MTDEQTISNLEAEVEHSRTRIIELGNKAFELHEKNRRLQTERSILIKALKIKLEEDD